MSDRVIRVFQDVERLSVAAAEEIAATLAETLASSELATFALVGGKTPRSVYARLASSPFLAAVPWSRIHFFWGDERHVPPSHPDSNFAMATETLLSRIPTPEAQIHRMRCELKSPAETARLYEEEIRRYVPGTPDPRLDLVLLGLGEDCHTASLFPGVTPDPDSLVAATFVPRLGAHRVTLTFRALNAAHRVMFLVAGSSKALSVSRALSGATDCPAAHVAPPRGQVTWLLDSEAASLLGSSATPAKDSANIR